MRTKESWFLYFHTDPNDPKLRDYATLQTTNGTRIMTMTSPLPGRNPDSEEIKANFEDNVRVAAAGNAMFSALEKLTAAARVAGIKPDHPALVAALQAIEQADPPRFDVTRDDKPLFRGTHNECFRYIHEHQGQSVDHAIKHEGWKIVAAEAAEPERQPQP